MLQLLAWLDPKSWAFLNTINPGTHIQQSKHEALKEMEDTGKCNDDKSTQQNADAIKLRPRTSSIKPPSYHHVLRTLPKSKPKKTVIAEERRLIRFIVGPMQEHARNEADGISSNTEMQQSMQLDDQSNAAMISHGLCNVCNGDGQFICCKTCSVSFHVECLKLPLSEESISRNDWCCDDCTIKRREALEREARTAAEDPLDRLLAKIRGMIPTAIQQQRQSRVKPRSDGTVNHVSKRAIPSARYCHYCRQVHLGKHLLICAYCPLAWHGECLPSPFILTKPFRCPAHVPDGIITSTPADPVAPYVLTDKALRMIGYSDAYPKFARVPEFIRLYYDEIKMQAMQSEPCHAAVETD